MIRPGRRFRTGHYVKWLSGQGRGNRPRRVPDPSLIPTGICECGCGQKTEIVTASQYSRRCFIGHPKPYVGKHKQRLWVKRRGPDHHMWQGGRIQTAGGYVLAWNAEHPAANKNGYLYEHRLVMEQRLGRYLRPEEVVHHRNGIRNDNRIENLELWTKAHKAGQRVTDLLTWAREIIATYETEEQLLLL